MINRVLATTGFTGALNNDAINVMKKIKGASKQGRLVKEKHSIPEHYQLQYIHTNLSTSLLIPNTEMC